MKRQRPSAQRRPLPTRKRASKATGFPPYKNPALSPDRRARDLLSRMTLEEKAAQMMCVWQQKADTLLDADGNFNLEKAQVAFKSRRGLGQVGRPSDAGKGKDA